MRPSLDVAAGQAIRGLILKCFCSKDCFIHSQTRYITQIVQQVIVYGFEVLDSSSVTSPALLGGYSMLKVGLDGTHLFHFISGHI